MNEKNLIHNVKRDLTLNVKSNIHSLGIFCIFFFTSLCLSIAVELGRLESLSPQRPLCVLDSFCFSAVLKPDAIFK